VSVKHKFVSPIFDCSDANLVRPSNWNDTHDLLGILAALDALVDGAGQLTNNGTGTLSWAAGGGVTDHAALSNLDFAGSLHTGFEPADATILKTGNASWIDLTDGGATTLHSHAADHTAVTLDTNADTILSLSTQALGLDTQTANRVWAGPTTGAAAVPTFRALVSGDIPALSYEPIDATIVRTGQANWIDLTDGGATTLHTHAYGDISGTGIVGQVAEFVTNTKTLQAANLIAPANLLTLVAGAPYTITFPATGTVPLLDRANVFTTQQMIDGASDQIQFRVQANATQTTNLITFENSAALVLAGIQGRGTYHCDLGVDVGNSLFIGFNAGNLAASGATYNVAIGTNAMTALTSGDYNVAVGKDALLKNTTGYGNFALGYKSLEECTEGYANVAIGQSALNKVVTREGNVAIGQSAANKNVAAYNTVVGSSAMFSNIGVGAAGSYNIVIGNNAAYSVKGGKENVAIGSSALQSVANATGIDYNVAIGEHSLFSIATGASNNVGIGYQAGYTISSGDNNIYIGSNAGYRQTTNSNLLIIDNTQRASAAVEQTNAILYGVMGATPSVQTLRINGVVTIAPTVAGALIIGEGTAGIDYNITFDGETNDGVLTWMEDEDYFQFADDVNINTGEVLKVGGTQVVGARVVDARCDDTINAVVWDSTTAGVLTALRDAMIAHGLIAAA
jgi:hypothetical protein